jgi:hypothetical protein
MLSSTRILTSRVVVKRALSSGVTSSNRLAIAQALLRAKTIRTAKDEAALKAASYLKNSSFSRSGLINQLLFEGFSKTEAEYGVSRTGL